MKLSVIVCTYNRANLLNLCLNSLIEQTADPTKYEVIIVNNNSTDNTHILINDFVNRINNFRYVFEGRQGLSYARNKGWQEATGDYIAFIDDDGKADRTWVEKILYSFTNVKPEPVAVGGKILPFFIEPKPSFFKEESEIRTWGDIPKILDKRNARFGFSGSNMAFQKRILEEFDGFSPRYGMKGNNIILGDEANLFSRIYDHYKSFWYDPSIIVYHYVDPIKFNKYYRIKRYFFLNVWNSIKLRSDQFIIYLKNLFAVRINK